MAHRQASFYIQLGHSEDGGCDPPDTFEGGVKFSIKIPDSEWSDVAIFSPTASSEETTVPTYIGDFEQPVMTTVWFCNEYLLEGIQFRWFQDIHPAKSDKSVWMMDSVEITSNGGNIVVFSDGFTNGSIR